MNLNKFQSIQKQENFAAWLAVKHHRTHKGEYLDFDNHPYAREILLDQSDYQIDKKSTQSGHTEIAGIKILAKAIQGLRCFCVWPTDTLLRQYVQERLNKEILLTPYYQAICSTNTKKSSDSTHMKDVGKGNIYLVCSNTQTAFTSYPADLVDIEELDECHHENVKMARERLDHSNYRLQYKRGNPKFNEMGIDAEFLLTDQKEWGLKCECGKWVFLDWFKHFVREVAKRRYELRDQDWSVNAGRDIYPICDNCGRLVDRKANGLWIPTFPGRAKSGRHTSKLFAGTSPMIDLYSNFGEALTDDTKMQRFYNADLGLAYTAEGAKITEQMIFDCMQDYGPGLEPGLKVAGIDVGKFYHYVIASLLPGGQVKTICIGKTMDTTELVNTMKEYGVKVGVIDALPETREARKICAQFELFFMCYFGNTKSDNTDLQRKVITVQRTPALDAVKEGLLTKTIMYANNIKSRAEFLKHMTASVRAFDEKRNCYDWVHGSIPDHYFLAQAYCLIAKRLILLLRG